MAVTKTKKNAPKKAAPKKSAVKEPAAKESAGTAKKAPAARPSLIMAGRGLGAYQCALIARV